ncbi:hypothetical protein [Vibrio sp. ER1A]|uniref:hypothetical protein n=1 Tax=Vibrio sp. ER1A TaxID=1517681 RepID=UPI0004DD39F6|nr:hypothetical protein HW45_07180 [Vibrio sp. ER1A]
MKLKPLHDWVIVKRDSNTDSKSNLYIPSQLSKRGKVLAIGPKVVKVEVGHYIQFGRYAGYQVTIEGHHVMFLHEQDISIILS